MEKHKTGRRRGASNIYAAYKEKGGEHNLPPHVINDILCVFNIWDRDKDGKWNDDDVKFLLGSTGERAEGRREEKRQKTKERGSS